MYFDLLAGGVDRLKNKYTERNVKNAVASLAFSAMDLVRQIDMGEVKAEAVIGELLHNTLLLHQLNGKPAEVFYTVGHLSYQLTQGNANTFETLKIVKLFIRAYMYELETGDETTINDLTELLLFMVFNIAEVLNLTNELLTLAESCVKTNEGLF